jgi:hypothetical protein
LLKAILSLEELIKENEERLKIAQEKLKLHESGEQKLSLTVLTSAENTIEIASKNLESFM